MPSPFKILLAYDFSEKSNSILNISYQLTKHYDCSVEVVYVIEDSGPLATIFNEDNYVEIERKLQTKFKKIVEPLPFKDDVSLIVKTGKVYTEIAKLIKEHHHNILLASINSNNGNNDIYVGSNLQRMLTSVNIPILVINKNEQAPNFKKAMVPVSSFTSLEDLSSVLSILKLLVSNKRIEIVEISDHQDEYQLNKNLLYLGQLKEHFDAQGFQTYTELIKIGKGEQSHAKIIADYAMRSESPLNVIPTFVNPSTRKSINIAFATELLAINKDNVLIVPITV